MTVNPAQRDPIVVAGGGIGGLTAALALGRKGWRVRVLEQAPKFGAIGYGIQLGPNVFRMFERLGVIDAVLAVCDFPPDILMLDAFTSDVILRVPGGERMRERFVHPYIVLHRVDLHQVLLDACKTIGTIELIPSASITGFTENDDGVVVRTEDGRAIAGAALIGADGLRSVVRGQLHSEGEPRMAGYVAHRTIVPMQDVTADVPRREVVLWSGPGYHIVHYPLRHASLFNIVAVFKTSTYAEKGDTAQYRAELEKTYRAAHPAMKSLLSMMDLGRRWPISDRDPIRHWSTKRVTLLGDAAHPTLQTLAQGAGMAIEDGVTIAEFIDRSGGDFESAFQQYQTTRVVRTARVQLESRTLWEVYHAEDVARDVMRDTFASQTEAETQHCLAWLFGGVALPGAGPDAANGQPRTTG